MKHFTLAAALLAAVTALPAEAQNPFEQQTKAVYIYSVNQNQFLSDYQSPTPATYCLQDYGPSRAEAILFELTTINEITGEGVLFTPWTDCYMSVPAGGSFVKATNDVEKRSILTFKDAGDGHKAIYSGTTLLSPYKNGAIMLLVGYTEAHQAAGWGKVEEALWDIVDAEDLDEFLVAHNIDPEYDPYVDPTPDPDPDPDPTPDPDPDKVTFEDLQLALNDAQAALLAAKGGIVTKGDGLITISNFRQFYSFYSDRDEGTDFDALIDGDPYTFWHSDWHGDAPEGPHSFDVIIENFEANTLFVAEYCGRLSGNNCSPIEMSIYGTFYTPEGGITEGVDPDEAYGDDYRPYVMADAPFTTVTREDGLGAFAGWGHSGNEDVLSGSFAFEADDIYDVFRFEPTIVTTDAGEGAEECFNYSEFQLYAGQRVGATVTADKTDVETLEALVAEAITLTKSEDPTDMVAALKAATEKIAPAEGISSIKATLPADARIYDLQGRRVFPEHDSKGSAHGLYIQNGRVLVK